MSRFFAGAFTFARCDVGFWSSAILIRLVLFSLVSIILNNYKLKIQPLRGAYQLFTLRLKICLSFFQIVKILAKFFGERARKLVKKSLIHSSDP